MAWCVRVSVSISVAVWLPIVSIAPVVIRRVQTFPVWTDGGRLLGLTEMYSNMWREHHAFCAHDACTDAGAEHLPKGVWQMRQQRRRHRHHQLRSRWKTYGGSQRLSSLPGFSVDLYPTVRDSPSPVALPAGMRVTRVSHEIRLSGERTECRTVLCVSG